MTKQPIKRYAIIGGSRYYPSGGFGDYRASFDTMDEALTECSKIEAKWLEEYGDPDMWFEITDLQTGETTKR